MAKKTATLVVDTQAFERELEEGTSMTVEYTVDKGEPKSQSVKAGERIEISTTGAPYGAWTNLPPKRPEVSFRLVSATDG